jgi:hypothetical protein
MVRSDLAPDGRMRMGDGRQETMTRAELEARVRVEMEPKP